MNLKKIHLCLLLLFVTLAASSQKVYFIYIQTENSQPFFVKLKDKIYSSTASGYIIIPKLVDTTYSFSIGLANNTAPQQNFSVAINRKDHGYLLKNFGDKGWGLFDLQTLDVKMSSTVAIKAAENTTATSKDVPAFTESLAKAAGDPSLKDRPTLPAKKDEKLIEPAISEKAPVVVAAKVTMDEPVTKTEIKPIAEDVVKKKESLTPEPVKEEKSNIKIEPLEEPASNKTAITPPVIIEPVQKKPETTPAVITEPIQKQVEITPSVITEPIQKQVEITPSVITEPVQKQVEITPSVITEPIQKQVEIVPAESAAPYQSSLIKKKSESSTTEGFGLTYTDTYASGATDTIRLLIPNPKTPAAVVKVEEQPMAVENKPGCSTIAAEADFFLLRKTMAAAEGDDAMISEAKKVCKDKCFSTTQYKNLSSLFLSDEGKYKFFDAVYNYTADAANFSSLQAELKEEYYINRFKAMLRN